MATLLRNAIPGVLIVISISIALVTFKQYGIAWDEPLQRKIGMINYAYVVKGDQQLHKFDDRDYGPALELPLYALEKALKLRTAEDIIQMRHIAAHLFFLLGAAFCFLLTDYLYKNKLLATIAFLLVMLHPRLRVIDNHSFATSNHLGDRMIPSIDLHVHLGAAQPEVAVEAQLDVEA